MDMQEKDEDLEKVEFDLKKPLAPQFKNKGLELNPLFQFNIFVKEFDDVIRFFEIFEATDLKNIYRIRRDFIIFLAKNRILTKAEPDTQPDIKIQ